MTAGRTRIARTLPVITVLALASLSTYIPRPAAGADERPGVKELVEAINSRVAEDYPRLDALYKHIHSHPELSLQEEQTAARLAKEMSEIGFEVTPKVGGHGLVCVLRNGDGPTVLVRT